MTTALELFRDALDLTDAVGADQQLTAEELQVCLRTFNRLLDNWSTQSLAVYGLANQTFNTVNGQATYTIGVGGNWNTTRPIRIAELAYSVYNNVSFNCTAITQGQYDAIVNKTQTQQFPYFFLYVNENPLGQVTLWPVPNQVTPITFSIERVLTQITDVYTELVFPPGYEEAFEYNLAVRLASRFSTPIPPEVAAQAASSLGDIKKANHSQRKRVMVSGIEYSDMGWWSDYRVWP